MYSNDNVIRQFLRDHPEHAAGFQVIRRPDGSEEECATVGACTAFVQWCLANGYGDEDKIIKFLTEAVPRLEALDRARKKPAGQSGSESE